MILWLKQQWKFGIEIDALGELGWISIIWNQEEISMNNFVTTRYFISVEFHIID